MNSFSLGKYFSQPNSLLKGYKQIVSIIQPSQNYINSNFGDRVKFSMNVCNNYCKKLNIIEYIYIYNQ